MINSVRARRFAFDLIGYGGMPSTHTAIVSTPAFLIGLREGWNSPVFSVATALAFIVVLDATSLRRQVGHHATRLNVLLDESLDHQPLRERVGHSRIEVLAGLLVGVSAASVLYIADLP